jgi:hypothetical protein
MTTFVRYPWGMSRASRLVLPAMVTMLMASAAPARAQSETVQAHSWLTYASFGIALGSATGLASSYLLDRHGYGFDRHPRLYGTGIGALSGLALGLTLGIVDRVGR